MDVDEFKRLFKHLIAVNPWHIKILLYIGYGVGTSLAFIENIWRLHRLVNWWFFYPLCPLVHSRRPALTMKPETNYQRFHLTCKSCGAELPHYRKEADAIIDKCMDAAEYDLKRGGCTWPTCACKEPGKDYKPYK